MRKVLAIVATIAAFSISAGAFAQDDEVQTRFYDFSDLLIDGELLRPDGQFMTSRGGARFQSLVQLRRSFRGEIDEAAREPALR
jgi:hypothetical protein